MDEVVPELAALDAEIAAKEERLLGERVGGPGLKAPEAAAAFGSPEPEPKAGFDDTVEAYAASLADALAREGERAPPWTSADRLVVHAAPAEEGRDRRSWWQRAQEYAAGPERDISKRGEIG